jgi:hypothetical protein
VKRSTSSTSTRDHEALRDRVLEFAAADLARRGVPFDRLTYTPSSNERYDGLVVVWQARHARTAGVTLPAAA